MPICADEPRNEVALRGSVTLPAMRTRSLAVLAALLLAPLACERFDPAPRELAEGFWEALSAGDFAAASALSDAAGPAPVRKLADELPLEGVELGDILRNESSAVVKTRGHLRSLDVDVDFNTHLTRVDGEWRVDLAETRGDLRSNALSASFGKVQQAFAESADLLVEEFEKRALEASEAFRGALEDLEDSLRGNPTPAP